MKSSYAIFFRAHDKREFCRIDLSHPLLSFQIALLDIPLPDNKMPRSSRPGYFVCFACDSPRLASRKR